MQSYVSRDTIKVVSLVQHIQGKLQLKAVRLLNVTIECHKFKSIPVYERVDKCIQSLFKEYQYELPENEGSIGFPTFHDIVKLLTLRGDSKYGLSTYYIKIFHVKNVFDHIIDRIGQIDLNGSSSINIIGFRKQRNK